MDSTALLTQEDFNFNLNFDTSRFFSLPGGPIAIATGVEYHRETSTNDSDALALQGLTFEAAAPTENGTYPVYSRFTVTTMSGLLPDGQTYHDTGIPWVSYFHGGDALHGFIRSSYGYPQSLGCVEMPFADAAVLWPHTPIGTLVTVQ